MTGAVPNLASAQRPASTAVLLWFHGAPFKTFLRAYGAGVALRGLIFVVLSAGVWGGAWAEQAPLLGSYALGVLGLLMVEYRQFKGKSE